MSGAPAKQDKSQLNIFDQLDELPTLPTIVRELSRAINNPMSSTKTIEKIMEKDQVLTARVLRLANSGYYAVPGGVSTMERAIAFLGFDIVNQLVLSSTVIGSLKLPAPAKFDLNQFWIHAMGVAIASEEIARQVRARMSHDYFTAGLMHDIGKVALSILKPETIGRICEHTLTNNLSFIESEHALGQMAHTQIGHVLAKKWNLPLGIQFSTLYHHTIELQARTGCSADTNKIVDAVLVANLIINNIAFGNSGHSKVVDLPLEVLERLNISQGQIPNLQEKIKIHLFNAESFLHMLLE